MDIAPRSNDSADTPRPGPSPLVVGAPASPLGQWPRPLAFALSGAGAFGSVQVGMLAALAERGITPDLVVGTSAGSLNGVVLARQPADAVEVLTDLWCTMSRRTVFGHGWLGAVRCLARTGRLSRLDHLGALIDTHLGPDAGFGSLTVPFAAVATDAVTGEPELLRSGPLKPALLASSAVPGLFPPVAIDGRHYVDGGIAANLPIRQAIAFGARSVIGLDATPPVPGGVPGGFIPGLLHSVSLIVRNQRAHAVDDLASRYPILVLPSVTPPDIGSFNFNRTRELLARSYEATCALLDDLPRPGLSAAAPAHGADPAIT